MKTEKSDPCFFGVNLENDLWRPLKIRIKHIEKAGEKWYNKAYEEKAVKRNAIQYVCGRNAVGKAVKAGGFS